MKCSHCGAEFEGNYCTECGAKAEARPQPSAEIGADQPKSRKPKKPIYKRWWFYVLAAVIVIAVAGRISGCSSAEKIDWDDMVLGAQLPQPPANKGKIHTNAADELWVDITGVSDKQYADYVQACQEAGFAVDAASDSSKYSAYNSAGYKLELTHYGSKDDLGIRLEAPMEMAAITWPDSEAGRQLPAPKSTTGKFSYERDDGFRVYIGGTSREDFDAYVKACSDQGFTVDYSKGDGTYSADNSAGWHVVLTYEGNRIMSIRIDAPDTKSGSTASEPATDPSASSGAAQNDAETAYYIDVQARVSKKLLEAAS